MKTRIIFFFIIATVYFTSSSAANSYTTVIEHKSDTSEYLAKWIIADSLRSAGLPKSALQVTNDIYILAKKENNSRQLIMAIIYRMMLDVIKDENQQVTQIKTIQKELEISEFPIAPVLHSLLGHLYWQYYQYNRYRFYNRSQTVAFDNDDINTWDLNKIIGTARHHYLKSVEQADSLSNYELGNIFSEFEIYGYSPFNEKPSLYDALANEALQFFLSSESAILKPAHQFDMNNVKYFEGSDEFMNFRITSPDSADHRFLSLYIFQNLMINHKENKEDKIFLQTDLRRLEYVYNKSTHPDKLELYISALKKLNNTHQDTEEEPLTFYHLANAYYQKALKYDPEISDIYRWELKKLWDFCQQSLDKFQKKNMPMGIDLCQSLINNIERINLRVLINEINIPDKPFLASVNYTNIDSLYIRIYKAEEPDIKEINKITSDYTRYKRNDYRNENRITIDHFLKEKAVKDFSVDLPVVSDFHEHTTEVKIPSLDVGEYIIIMSSNAAFKYDSNTVVYDYIRVSDLSYAFRNQDNGFNEFIILNRSTGKPVKGAMLEAFKTRYNKGLRSYILKSAGSAVSDENGFVKEINTGEEYAYYNIKISTKDDYLYSSSVDNRMQTQFYGYKTRRIEPSTYTYTHFFTDRAIYRPGQTIYFKGIIYDSDTKTNTIRKNYKSTVYFYDVNHQLIDQLDVTTNEFGTFSGEFKIPRGKLNGNMSLQCIRGNHYFMVEEYKRPKFDVNFEKIEGTYRLEDTVRLAGLAKSFSGTGVDGAVVKYRVTRTYSYPYFYYYYWNNTQQETEILNSTAVTDKNGKFKIHFAALPDNTVSKDKKPVYTYTIVADVTDINGETHSAEKTITVGYTALLVDISLPEYLNKLEKNSYKITTSNLNGDFEGVSGKIRFTKLKSPSVGYFERKWGKPDKYAIDEEDFKKDFNHELYKDENNIDKWEIESVVYQTIFNTNTKKEYNLEECNNWPSGKYMVEIETKDKYNETIQIKKYFTVYSAEDDKVPYPVTDMFIVKKGKGQPGENAEIIIGTGLDTIYALIEIEYDKNIIEKKWYILSNEQKLLEIPIVEKYRGNFGIHYTCITNNRLIKHSQNISVPYSNKKLDIEFVTFRNKLLPGENEEWKLKIKGPEGEKVAAEMVATLYDASLDEFAMHNLLFSPYHYSTVQKAWQSYSCFNISDSRQENSWPYAYFGLTMTYVKLNWYGYNYYYRFSDYYADRDKKTQSVTSAVYSSRSAAQPMALAGFSDLEFSADDMALDEVVAVGYGQEKSKEETVQNEAVEPKAPLEGNYKNGEMERTGNGEKSLSTIKARTNFNETAFFMPHLQTNEEGEILINFTIPESLTKWKMRGYAHTQDLKYGTIENELVTRKTLMVVPNAPRFFREGDEIVFTSKISNVADTDLKGKVKLMLFDATTMQPVDEAFLNMNSTKPVKIKQGESTNVSWSLKIPADYDAVTYRVVASAGKHSDGEEMAIPVLSNRMMVTETLPLWVRSNQTKEFSFDKLKTNTSTTLKHHKLTLEFTTNPAWNAIQSLPYLMHYPYDCMEQTFSKYYANSIASHIVNSSPKIKEVFDQWQSNPESKALTSNLEKNEELKYLLLEETPWVMEGKSESERKKRIAILFDLEKMASEKEYALNKLLEGQHPSGAWPWFAGMYPNRYITQHIVANIGHLDKLEVQDAKENAQLKRMLKNALDYMDREMLKEYKELLRIYTDTLINKSNQLSYSAIQYLYARSFFMEIDIPVKNNEVNEFLKDQAKKYWKEQNLYMQGMIAIALNRWGDKETAVAIVKSLKEKAIQSEELGMYWNDGNSYFWYQAPIERQALFIELFNEVAGDQESIDEMRIWLLKQKQVQDWRTTKATVEACYALLLSGTNWLETSYDVNVNIGDKSFDFNKMKDENIEVGTGYYKTSWTGDQVTTDMGNVKVSKKNEGISWGAVYWQYFEQLDKITPAETPLSIKKKLFREVYSDKGRYIEPVDSLISLQVGDKIIVRIELRADRQMEYIHMKDMRASGLEPINVVSTYKYQDGLGYYESTKDASTNFFMDYLPKGTYVFEYPLWVTHSGNFSNGITTIQCMYAPEFTSHSEGIRIDVK